MTVQHKKYKEILSTLGSFFSLSNKKFVTLLFLCLFVYLIFRAIFVELLLDELITIYAYIQSGNILGEHAWLDSNNHLLNSYFSHYIYSLFGDNYVVYRLFAICSFPLYFFTAKKLVERTVPRFSLFVFIALLTVHWIFEYFGFSRGYGPSLAFFMTAILMIERWNQQSSIKFYYIFIACLLASLLSNLSMLIPLLILFLYVQIRYFFEFKHQNLKQRVQFYLLSLVFTIALIPIYGYITKLKLAGALWWGSTEGLWEVTGKSISKNIFFTESIMIKYALFVILVFILFFLINAWKSKGFLQGMKDIKIWVPALFFACLIGFIFLAKFMGINYPQDRVGMFLVILIILSVGVLFSENKYFRWLLVLLIWFPSSFIWNMNLNTSIFSPEDRIHRNFYAQFEKVIQESDLVAIDYQAHTSYAYLTRKNNQMHMAFENINRNEILCDYYITWAAPINWKGFKQIMFDSITKTSVYKNIHKIEKELIFDTIISEIKSDDLFVNLKKFDFEDEKKFSKIQVEVSGSVDIKNEGEGLDLIFSYTKKDGSISFLPSRFGWYCGSKRNFSFIYPSGIYNLSNEDENVLIYLLNARTNKLKLSNFEIKIFGIR